MLSININLYPRESAIHFPHTYPLDSAIHLLNNQAQAHSKELESERAQRLKCWWHTQLEWTRGLSP